MLLFATLRYIEDEIWDDFDDFYAYSCFMITQSAVFKDALFWDHLSRLLPFKIRKISQEKREKNIFMKHKIPRTSVQPKPGFGIGNQ